MGKSVSLSFNVQLDTSVCFDVVSRVIIVATSLIVLHFFYKKKKLTKRMDESRVKFKLSNCCSLKGKVKKRCCNCNIRGILTISTENFEITGKSLEVK